METSTTVLCYMLMENWLAGTSDILLKYTILVMNIIVSVFE